MYYSQPVSSKKILSRLNCCNIITIIAKSVFHTLCLYNLGQGYFSDIQWFCEYIPWPPLHSLSLAIAYTVLLLAWTIHFCFQTTFEFSLLNFLIYYANYPLQTE